MVLKKNCCIGTNSIIFAGVTIEEYSIVGASSVVTKDIPSFSLAYGVPSRVVRSYTKDEIQ